MDSTRRKKADLVVTNAGCLPMDVLFEVLVRLPASLICRLRLVCRSWRSLITDRVFAAAHASRHRPLLAGVHKGNPGHEVHVVDLSGNVVKRLPIKQQAACCVCNTQLDLVWVSEVVLRYHQRPRSSLVNIATGEVATLIPDVHDGDAPGFLFPLFLGHVPSTGERKVFYCRCSSMRGGGRVVLVQRCIVATLAGSNAGMWRVTPSPPVLVSLDSLGRVVIGGTAFFLLDQRNNHGSLEPDAIVMLNLATEEWRPATLQGPLSSRLAAGKGEKLVYLDHRNDVRLAAVNGCLVTVHHNRFQEDASTDLWFLEDMDVDKGLWTKRYSIRCATSNCREFASSASYPLLVLDYGRIVMWVERAHSLRAYDPRTSKGADLATLTSCFSMSMYQGNLL